VFLPGGEQGEVPEAVEIENEKVTTVVPTNRWSTWATSYVTSIRESPTRAEASHQRREAMPRTLGAPTPPALLRRGSATTGKRSKAGGGVAKRSCFANMIEEE